MKTGKLTIYFLLITLCMACQQETPDYSDAKIEAYLQEIVKTHQLPGLAVAVIKKGKVHYKGYFGHHGLEKKEEVNPKTVFRVFSTSKLITATAVFKLIEEQQLSLDDQISTYLNDLPEQWHDIQIRHLLTHSSGLPDLIHYESDVSDQELLANLSDDEMVFTKGSRFAYNQTNYWLLARIIEKISGKTFDDFVLAHQFQENAKEAFFSSNSFTEIPNRAANYRYQSETSAYKKVLIDNGIRAHSGNGLNITLDQMIAWNEKLDNNELLSPATKSLMWSRFNYDNPKDQMMHGWGIYPVNDHISLGFTGGQVSGFRKFIDQDITIIFLSTGFRYFPVHNRVIDHIAGLVDQELLNKEGLLEEELVNAFITDNVENAEQYYLKIQKEAPEHSFEGVLNAIGYILMGNNRLKDAISVFELNVREHPESSNPHDSLGESYLNNDELERAIKSYQKSLELNPENQNAEVMIGKIQERLKQS